MIHPCCIYQSFVPFCGQVAFQLCGCIVICLLIHLLMDIWAVPTLGPLGIKLPWTCMHMPLREHMFWFPFRKYSRVECLGHMAATYMFNFVRNCPMAFQRGCTVSSTSPGAAARGRSGSSTSWPIIWSFIKYSSIPMCGVESQCGFSLHFPDNEWPSLCLMLFLT